MFPHKCPYKNYKVCPKNCTKMYRISHEHWCYDKRYLLNAEITCEEHGNKNQKVKHIGEQYIGVDNEDKLVPSTYFDEDELV